MELTFVVLFSLLCFLQPNSLCFEVIVKMKKKRKQKNISNISTKLGLRKFKITKPTILGLTYELLSISSTTKQAWKKNNDTGVPNLIIGYQSLL